eukprot:CFRG2433T1
MANVTAKDAMQIHGRNPQHLVEKIIRTRIYDSRYWKEDCFALTAESLIDKAVELNYCGGIYGGNIKPTPFMCLLLKMLQIQPDKEIIVEFIKNEDYKYIRLLGSLYLRLTASSQDCYKYLEPLYDDFRCIRVKNRSGSLVRGHVDEFIDDLLHEDRVCDVILPRVQKRYILEETGEIQPRVSAIDDLLEDDEDTEKESDDELATSTRDQPVSHKSASTNMDVDVDVNVNESERKNDDRDKERGIEKKDRERERSDRHSRRDRSRGDERRDKERRRRRESSRDRERGTHRDTHREKERESRRDRDRDRDRGRERESGRRRGRGSERSGDKEDRHRGDRHERDRGGDRHRSKEYRDRSGRRGYRDLDRPDDSSRSRHRSRSRSRSNRRKNRSESRDRKTRNRKSRSPSESDSSSARSRSPSPKRARKVPRSISRSRSRSRSRNRNASRSRSVSVDVVSDNDMDLDSIPMPGEAPAVVAPVSTTLPPQATKASSGSTKGGGKHILKLKGDSKAKDKREKKNSSKLLDSASKSKNVDLESTGGGAKESMSVDDTNALRAKLGLKPLR